MSCIAFYPGSFDPVTYGHLDIIVRAARLVDELIIGVGIHHNKKAVFLPDQRVGMLEVEKQHLSDKGIKNISIVTFDNLVVEAAKSHGAGVIIRGLRDSGDFDYEMQMAGMNAGLDAEIETIFLASSPKFRHIAASLVRQIALMGGDVKPFVPDHVAKRLKQLTA